MAVVEAPTEEEAYLYALMTDPSGIDLAELCWVDDSDESPDGCWRARPYQWSWWHCPDPQQIEQSARSVGKTLGIKARLFSFPFRFPGQEAVITAPELIHLEPITDLVERQFFDCRLGREMMLKGRSDITHRPFMMRFANGSRLIGRIPQRDGKGVKGCCVAGTPVLTDHGYVNVEDLRPGDLVLTHAGRYMPVQHIETDVNDCYEVRGQGSLPLTVSCDHRFYGAPNLAKPKQRRRFGELEFDDVEFLLRNHFYWATPTRFPALPVPPLEVTGTARSVKMDSRYFWWLVGRWIADGYLSMDKKTGKSRRVHWVVHADKAIGIEDSLRHLGFRPRTTTRTHSSAVVIDIASAPLYRWLSEQFGEGAQGKHIPTWLLGMLSTDRRPAVGAFLDGYLGGDGHWSQERKRWECGTASRDLALGLQLLAQGLGYTVNCGLITPKPNSMCASPKPSYRLQILDGHPVRVRDHLVAKVKSVQRVGKRRIYNPIVAEDHSYLTGAIVSHNIHPILLELDEAQDFPKDGWTELNETLQMGREGAQWRAHGVTRGVRDKFYEYTQDTPDNPWTVHRITAMNHPNWNDEQRARKLKQYNNSREDPDYRRNVLGLHGDATNPIFVLRRLMKCVDEDLSSDYNTADYTHIRITEEMLHDRGQQLDIVDFLLFPHSHRQHKTVWCGMDIGFTSDPSEILIFAEYHPTELERKAAKTAEPARACPEPGLSRLKLLSRVSLFRISSPQQIRAILAIMDFYNPRAFSLDKTGAGLPLFQDLQDMFEKETLSTRARDAAARIKGYNFSAKVVVEIDETVEVEDSEDPLKDSAIHANVLEFSTDQLRTYVDKERLWLPWDRDMISEFQGQTYSYSKAGIDAYGRRRRIFSEGSFHALDAARMAVMGHAQQAIEELLNTPAEKVPVLDQFVLA